MRKVLIPLVIAFDVQAAAAQQADAPANDPEIIVIGERLDQPLGETASSVTVLTGEEVDGRGIDRARDLLDEIPNIYGVAGSRGPAVRGIDSTGATRDLPAFLAGVRPRMAMTVDGREASYHEFVFGALPLWDVKQIEIFRTPQTISRGRNAIAGAVHIVTRDPTFEWEAAARGSVGNYDLATASAMVSGPLAGDDLAFRAAFDGRWSRPTSDMSAPGMFDFHEEDNHRTTRLKLLVAPSDIPTLDVTFAYNRTDSLMPQAEGVRAPFMVRRDPTATYGDFDIGIDAWTASANLDLSDRWRIEAQAATTRGDVARIAPQGLGNTQTDYRDRSLEARAIRDAGPLRVTLGYHHARLEQDQDIDVSRLVGIAHYREHRVGNGLFAQLQAELGDAVIVEAGLRHQQDRHRRTGGFEGFPEVDLDVDLEENFLLPRLAVSTRIAEGWRAGVLVLKATNAGGNVVPLRVDDDGAFGREWLWDAEVFVRGEFDGGRGSLEFNLFRNWIRDFQRSEARSVDIQGAPANLVLAKVINVPEALSTGAELSARWTAGRWSASAALGWLDTEYIDVTGLSDVAVGNEFGRAPRWTLSVGAAVEAGDGWTMAGTLRAHSGLFSDDSNAAFGRVDAAAYADLRIEKSFGDKRLFAFARNVFDHYQMEYYATPTFATASSPRMVAIGMVADF